MRGSRIQFAVECQPSGERRGTLLLLQWSRVSLMALTVRLYPGQRIVMNDAYFAVLKRTTLEIENEVDIRIYNPDGTLRHHSPKKD